MVAQFVLFASQDSVSISFVSIFQNQGFLESINKDDYAKLIYPNYDNVTLSLYSSCPIQDRKSFRILSTLYIK